MKWLLVVAALASSCADNNVDVAVEPGIVGRNYPDPVVPSSARIGEPFTVTVTTEGGGCRRLDSTDAVVMGDTAIVTPYDAYLTYHDGTACTLDLRPLVHEVTLTFDMAGTKTVLIHARSPQEDDIEIERQLIVE